MNIIEVATGELKVRKRRGILKASAIGSCIGVAVFDPAVKLGGLAHIMLPDRAPLKKRKYRFRYAVNALDELFRLFEEKGGDPDGSVICLAGGGNILQKDDDIVCDANIRSVKAYMEENGYPVAEEVLGGTLRRSLMLEIPAGRILYTEGDSKEKLLWFPQ